MSGANVMLDLETMGNTSNAAIIEIGACVFSSKHGLGSEFSVEIDLQSSMDAGLTVDASTIMWWMMQKWEARGRFKGNSKAATLEYALEEFRKWIPKGSTVWGNGSDFDNVILENAYVAIGEKAPWDTARNNRCFRTMKNIFREVKKPENIGVAHSALDDAKLQAEWILKIYKECLV